MTWHSYRFANGEEVYCEALKKNVKVTYNYYTPIWIGDIPYDNANDFWKDNWQGSGYASLKETENQGWPFNYKNIKAARESGFGAGYIDPVELEIVEGKHTILLSQNGFLRKDDECGLLTQWFINNLKWDKKKPFIVKLSKLNRLKGSLVVGTTKS